VTETVLPAEGPELETVPAVRTTAKEDSARSAWMIAIAMRTQLRFETLCLAEQLGKDKGS
jgi:hypothetical protein